MSKLNRSDVLPELLRPHLKLVVCGTAAGNISALRRAYYAGPGNRFWDILRDSSLVPLLLRPEEFGLLPSHGIGLTDLVKLEAGLDADLSARSYDAERFISSIRINQPRFVAFNGIKAARTFLKALGLACKGPLPYELDSLPGFTEAIRRRELITIAFRSLPSTSGAARGFWNGGQGWFSLASEVQGGSKQHAISGLSSTS